MATSIVRSTANRAVHLQLMPRTSNLGESREILRLISQFGEVEYFKSLKYDTLSAPNAALVIFKDEDAAEHCLHKSPIRFRMGRAPVGEQLDTIPQPTNEQHQPEPPTEPPTRGPRGPSGTAFGMGQTRSMSTDSLPKPALQPGPTPFEPPPQPLLESRIFQIQANPARVHFRDQINMGPYHGSFPLDTKGLAQFDLAKRVPTPGLSCVNWRAEGRPWRIMQKEKEKEQNGPSKRKSLRELYDEGPEGAASFRDEALPG